MHKDMVLTSMPMIDEQTMESPVIPPGANPVEEKKKFTASAVKAAAIVIHT